MEFFDKSLGKAFKSVNHKFFIALLSNDGIIYGTHYVMAFILQVQEPKSLEVCGFDHESYGVPPAGSSCRRDLIADRCYFEFCLII